MLVGMLAAESKNLLVRNSLGIATWLVLGVASLTLGFMYLSGRRSRTSVVFEPPYVSWAGPHGLEICLMYAIAPVTASWIVSKTEGPTVLLLGEPLEMAQIQGGTPTRGGMLQNFQIILIPYPVDYPRIEEAGYVEVDFSVKLVDKGNGSLRRHRVSIPPR